MAGQKGKKINRQTHNYREVIMQFVTIQMICKFNVWFSTLKNKNTTSADRLMNRQSVFPLSSSVCLQSVSRVRVPVEES